MISLSFSKRTSNHCTILIIYHHIRKSTQKQGRMWKRREKDNLYTWSTAKGFSLRRSCQRKQTDEVYSENIEFWQIPAAQTPHPSALRAATFSSRRRLCRSKKQTTPKRSGLLWKIMSLRTTAPAGAYKRATAAGGS